MMRFAKLLTADLLIEELDLNKFNIDQQGSIGDEDIDYTVLDDRKHIVTQLSIGLYETNRRYITQRYPNLVPTMREAGVNGFYSITTVISRMQYQKQGLGSQLYNEVANQLWEKKYMLVSTGNFIRNKETGEQPGKNLWASLVRKGKAKELHPNSAIGHEGEKRYVYVIDDPSFRDAYKIFTQEDLLENKKA